MMHGHEKSDPAIVAVKPANKAANPAVEQSAAEPATVEPVEPRAGTKGNADQQSTCRAQSRVSVSQALDRIRKVAKERKKERFTALFHHISDASRFLDEMRERLQKFALTLHPEKTRLIEFGRFAAERRQRRGLGKPETFNFLGFHLHLRQDSPGQIPTTTEDPTGPHAGEAQDDQSGDVAA